jgi:hypothetical protein
MLYVVQPVLLFPFLKVFLFFKLKTLGSDAHPGHSASRVEFASSEGGRAEL